jgi:hypothetical protein
MCEEWKMKKPPIDQVGGFQGFLFAFLPFGRADESMPKGESQTQHLYLRGKMVNPMSCFFYGMLRKTV